MVNPKSTAPSPPTSFVDRGLRHPADDRGPLLDKLMRNSRGVNMADPRIENPSVSFPATEDAKKDYHMGDPMGKLKMGEAGTGRSRS